MKGRRYYYDTQSSNQDTLREQIAEAIMQPWFDQVTTGSGMEGDPPVTTISVKDKQIDRIEALVLSAKAEAVEEFTKNATVFEDFKCSEHGKQTPLPECPKCFAEQADPIEQAVKDKEEE